jgi:CubicO group peptidase (beta-lactamase class C family)
MSMVSRTSISRISRAFLLGAAVAILGGSAQAAPPADLDTFVAQSMKTFGPPGMTVAIVEDGKIALTKGYGIRTLGKAAPV